MAAPMNLRRPVEADHDEIVRRIDDWAGGRKARHLLPRLWFRHFTGTSWVATRPDGRVVGLAIGFVSPDDPTLAVLHALAVDPAHRRGGVGSALADRFAQDAAGHGATTARTTAWPDDRRMIAFLEAVGYRLVKPADGQRLYGTPAIADFDEPGDDRAELERPLDGLGAEPHAGGG
ncbi:MAG: GNAT family N-acetyltransferase [Chloroflexota bacterium]